MTATSAARRPDAFWGMAAFLATDVVMFLLLLVAQVYLRRSSHGPGAGTLEPGTTLLFSLALWASSGSLVLAERLRRRSATWGGFMYLLTATLGLVFVIGQVREDLHLARQGVQIHSDLFFTGFYTLTGLHGLHVIAGLPMLVTLAVLAWRRRLGEGGASAVSLYWHFVDVVWVVLFLALYVWRGP